MPHLPTATTPTLRPPKVWQKSRRVEAECVAHRSTKTNRTAENRKNSLVPIETTISMRHLQKLKAPLGFVNDTMALGSGYHTYNFH